MSFNGEIYNYKEIKKNLTDQFDDIQWRGKSDTEVLLNALIYWGIDSTLSYINGMFAFAFWDSETNNLFLARDRMGEKPLYYGRSNQVFLFGSELNCLRQHPSFKNDIDRDALALYMRHNCVPSPRSIYSGIFKLPPAHYIVVNQDSNNILEPKCYWSINNIAKSGYFSEEISYHQILENLDSLLHESIKSRMISDVPIGAFLSGGYDSSTIVAIMQSQVSRPVRTFSIGLENKIYNEADHAKKVAQYLGTDHTELYIQSNDLLSVIPRLPYIYDEPFADSSQIPTYLVSQMSREKVKVVLSGDGGDELFGGYNRHISGPSIWNNIKRISPRFRIKISNILNSISKYELENINNFLPNVYKINNINSKIIKLSSSLSSRDSSDFYKKIVSHFDNTESIVLNSHEPKTPLDSKLIKNEFPNLLERMMFLDQLTYLPDDILTKLDRASMAVSLEARVPFLDHRLLEFAWKIKPELKVDSGKGKVILRNLLYQYLPKGMMERPKMGFAVPIDEWLRGPLRNWANELLSERTIKNDGYFNSIVVKKLWEEHLSGKKNWQNQLWDILMFQMWFNTYHRT